MAEEIQESCSTEDAKVDECSFEFSRFVIFGDLADGRIIRIFRRRVDETAGIESPEYDFGCLGKCG
jgi:hypothetical protein